MRALATLLVLTACAEPAPPAPLEHSAAWVVAQVFGPSFFDAEQRQALMAPRVDETLHLPALIEHDRYRFLQVAELRRVDADHRVGEVAFALDGWPAELAVELTRDAGGWRLSRVADDAAQQAIVELLGIRGLPRARTAEPWPGGLAGRDRSGRPTAAALVLGSAAGLWVDGQPVREEAAAVKSALSDALAARHQLAWVAHATYRPHVAIALPADAPAIRHAQLARWAVEAGAEALMLIVRDPQGGPAFLPLARAEAVAEGEVAPPTITVTQTPEGAGLTVGTETAAVVLEDPTATRTGIERLRAAAPAVGFLLTPSAAGTHSEVVALIDALRRAAPTLPIAPYSPQ